MTTTHITKDELLRAEVGDTFILIDNINTSMHFDGNSFVDGMESDTPLTISDMGNAHRHGVHTLEIIGKGYTYDMIKAIFRDGELLYGVFGDDFKQKITHSTYIKKLKEKGIRLTNEEFIISRDYISNAEFNDIKEGDMVNLRLDLQHGRTYGEFRFNNEMNQYNKDSHIMKKLTVEHKRDTFISFKESGYNFSREMIESVIRK